MTIVWDCSELHAAVKIIDSFNAVDNTFQTSQDMEQDAAGTNDSKPDFRGDKLETALESMCRRGDFLGAIIADEDGFPLADFNSPVDVDKIAAFTSVLGESITQGENLLAEETVNNISMDINYTDKIVLRRFMGNNSYFHLLAICPQDVDERSEMEFTVEEIANMIA